MLSYSNIVLALLNNQVVALGSLHLDADVFELLASTGLITHSDKRYSIIDLIWIGIVERCYAFGFKAEEIKTLYEGLYYKADTVSICPLERAVLHILQQDSPTFLVVSEGIQEFWLLDVLCYTDYLSSGILKDHLLIHINSLTRGLLPNVSSPTTTNKDKSVRDLVFQIVQRLHNPACKSIKLIKKQGALDLIEEVEHLPSQTKLSALLSENSYQDINIKTAGGKIAYIERTTRQKIQKGETHP